MKFFMHAVVVVAMMAGSAEAGIITMSEDLSLGSRFMPEAIDEKGELIYFDLTDIGGGGAVWLSADGANNHLDRQYTAGGYRYGIKRIPGAVVDEAEFATVDWIQHHRDGVLEFGGNDSRGLVEFFAESDEVLEPGYLDITLRNDWEFSVWRVNGELLYEHTTGQSNLQTFRYDLPTGSDGLRFEFAGSGTADGVIERIEHHEYTTVPEPSLGDLLDLIGGGIGGLIGW
jgi:hypothetical protein